MLFHNNKHQNKEPQEKKQRIIVNTDYGSIEIVDLRRIWVNEFLGTYRLMYMDSIYEYNCIYWSDSRNSINRYLEYKRKIMEAYNRGDKIVEI